MRQRFHAAEEAEAESRELELDDLKFRSGEQWPDKTKRERLQDDRPCLVINRIPQAIQQVTNDQRQNRPAIKVFPVDDGADEETAKKIQGLTRHIEYNSNAEVAYDTAFEGAVTGGLGYFRVIPAYVDDKSFDQELLIKAIQSRFTVYTDPYWKECDGSDIDHAFIVNDMSEDEFKREFPGSKLTSLTDWSSIGDTCDHWVKQDSVRLAEYLYRDFTEVTIVQMSDGAVGNKEDLPDQLPPGIRIVRERKAQKCMIRWIKTNGIEILEETEIDIPWVPIFPVMGTVLFIDGKRIVSGIVRDAKDPQRMVNYMTSNEAEAIALAPRAPFIIAEGQVEGYEEQWQSANRKNHAYLPYRMADLNGTPAPPPQRNHYEPAVQAITQAKMIAIDDLKATTGIYDASLGNRSNESSGVAIQRRNAQTQTSNYHYMDNLSRTMRHCGRVLVNWIPKVYDSAREVRIIGEEGDQEIVMINEPIDQGPGREPILYDVTTGKYDVIVETGPSFATKRQEAAENMMGMTKAYPPLMQIAGDLIWKNFDFPGAAEVAERIKKTIDPKLIDDKKKNPIPPEAQAQMAQMGQMIEQLTAEAKESAKVIEMKLVELESKERIEMRKLEVQAEIELAKIGSKEAQVLLMQEIAQLNARGQQLGNQEPIETQSNDAGPEGALAPQEQQPTGGFSPGQSMGVMP